jgi:DNA-binding LacI/PurR family transcriptional regulator
MTAELRQDIRSGDLKPGSKLPTEPELAKQFDISITSVRRGIDILVRERLVERKQGSGTYVLDIQSVPRPGRVRDTVAIAMPLELCVYHPFFSEVTQGLRRQLGVRNWKTYELQFKSHSTAPHDIAALPADPESVLSELLRHDELAGGIFGTSLIEQLAPRLPSGFATVAVDPTDTCPHATYDTEYEINRGLELLERQGAKHIWVCGGTPPALLPGGRKSTRQAKIAWYRPRGSALLSEITREAFDAACAALTKDDQIDGVLAGDDYTAQGVLDAISKCGIRVPEKVKVAALVNRASRISMRFPVTTLVADGYLKGIALADLLHEHLISPATAPKRVQLACSVEYR